jgi:murein DD-endopeptidase MepM/ murein hydrolase activator NlpD
VTVGVLGLMLTACTEYQPVHWGGSVPWEQARKAIYDGSDETSRLVPVNGRHVVMPGETVSELAVLYRVPSQEIVALNGLSPPYHIYVGQVLRLPRSAPTSPADGLVHLVDRGDTLSGIAAAYGVKLGDVLALNRTVDPARLRVGTAVRLPAGTGTQVASAPPRPPSRSVAPRPAPAPSQASGPAQGPVAVAAATPSPQAAGVRTTELAPPPGVAVTPEPAARPAAAAEPSVAAAPADREARQDAARQRDLAAVPAPPLSGDGFLWPVDAGDLISAFGAKPDGRRNDGINIAAPAGTIVRAAENGLVVYADEDLAAFGRMLLIRHADGFLTAYAHNDALLVTRGDTVTRGQPIAKVGRSGEVVEPQLHFEIRRGKNAVDPVALLGDGDVRLAQRQ